MVNVCLRCNNPFGLNLPECPSCSLPNFNAMPWIPEDIKQEYLAKIGKKTDINQKLLETSFRKILKQTR